MRISDWSSDVCASDLGNDIVVSEQRRFAVMRPGKIAGQVDDGSLQRAGGLAAIALAVHPGAALLALTRIQVDRSEERRVGKGCVSTFCSRWSPDHTKKNKHQLI